MGWEDRAYNRDDNGGIPPVQFRLPKLSRLTMWLIGINLALFLLKIVPSAYEASLQNGALRFGGIHGLQLWRWVSYQYLHGDAFHVLFNMLGVYFFLPTLETRWGWQKALGFYTLGGIAAGLAFLLITASMGMSRASLIGASGSVFAIMGAVALFYPERQLILLLFPVPIRFAVALFAVIFTLSAVADRDASNAAHLGGLVFGFCAPWLAGPWLSQKQSSMKRWQAERAVQSELSEQQEVDRILAKVADSGMHSLTSCEKKALARATENQRIRDKAKAKRGPTY